MQKSGQMVLKGVNWVNWIHNVKIRSYGLERSQLGTECKNQVKWLNCLERSQLGYTIGILTGVNCTQYKNQVIWS